MSESILSKDCFLFRAKPIVINHRESMRAFSKSKLMALRQCPKRLWLEMHHPELREDSAASLASFQVGYEVGEIAQRLYDPYGTGVLIDVKTEGFNQAFARSAELLGQDQPIFEAGFSAAGALAFADVMLPSHNKGKRVWRMVEVKSSTSVKDYHRDDIAVQAYVAKEAGVALESIALAHVDSSWVYPGDDNYQGLLKENDLTAEAFSRTDEVKGWIAEAQSINAQTEAPVVSVGKQCHRPYDCGFYTHCSQGLPQPAFPLDCLPHFSASKREKLAAEGIIDLNDVPDEYLNEKQKRVKQHSLANTVYFDAKGAAAALANQGLPAYFLDFETIQFAVPIWKGTRPYQKITFQFSLHRIGRNGELKHSEFLDISGQNPAPAFAQALIDLCGKQGPVYVYNAGFEKSCISDLAKMYPHLSPALLAINERVVDLLPIARDYFYHPSQQGSWSIKKVLPAVVPELRYDQLDGVQDGGMAMDAFLEALHPDTQPERKRQIENQLLEYCKLDTYAMVRLWEVFAGKKKLKL